MNNRNTLYNWKTKDNCMNFNGLCYLLKISGGILPFWGGGFWMEDHNHILDGRQMYYLPDPRIDTKYGNRTGYHEFYQVLDTTHEYPYLHIIKYPL